MLHFKRVNNITGWAVFGIAALTYILTAEPTASYWDCGEFIATSYKLQVPHPPGAPLFLLINRMFAMLAGNNTDQVAHLINISSALASAFTSLFLFWTITLLGRRVLKINSDELTLSQTILLMGAGVIGALAYTFCDSAWFSAVEAEVYALSSFFTALVVWAMLKWELIEDEAAANRWLIFIAYTIGLSIGIHLLNLVTLPALAFVFYFKKYKPTLVGGAITFISGIAIIFFIMSGIIPGLPSLAGNIEIFFKNSLGLPFGTGIALFVATILGGLIFGLYYTQKNRNELFNTILLSLTFILIGYGSYALVPIRSIHNPPINENNPSDIIEIVKYLKREQYGDRPLLLGPSFSTPVTKQEPDKSQPLYRKGKDKYEVYDYKYKTEFDPSQQMLLPRLFSRSDDHEQRYMKMLGLDKNGNGKIDRDPETGEVIEAERPHFSDNLRFLFQHQLGHMYLRYFMWNFASRESDIEGAGWLKPWEIKTADMPDDLKNNRGRNQFFWLPLFLGVLGLFFQYQKDSKAFLVTLLLFILTGIALVIYLNSPPVEPRERDYIYVGSYYAFAIWIGMGVMAVAELLGRVIKNQVTAGAVATAVCSVVPVVMVAQGWDDHDRSNRYQQVDSAKNLLNSCAKNAILFTGGDNDTFPLWYVQEVEGFRTDVRVCNLSLLGTDWYVEQMKRKTYLSEPLPITFPFDRFIQGTNDVVYFVEDPSLKNGMDLSTYLKAVRDNVNDPRIKIANGDEVFTKLPTNNMILKTDSTTLANSNVIPDKYKPYLRNYMAWSLPKANLYKPELMQLEMISNIAAANWNRPIYFSTSMGFPGRNTSFLALQDYLVLEGMAYRLLPVKIPKAPGTGTAINTDIMFENMTKNMFWREMNNPKVYYDDNYREKSWTPSRMYFYFLAQTLISEGKKAEAAEAIKYSLKVMPDEVVPLDYISSRYIPLLYETGETKLADELKNKVVGRVEQSLAYYGGTGIKEVPQDLVSTNLQILSTFAEFYEEKGDSVQAKKYQTMVMKNYQKFRSLGVE